jgi:hypothetical protein
LCLTHSFIWSFCYFFVALYILFCTTVVFYLIPNMFKFTLVSTTSNRFYFFLLPGSTNLLFTISPLVVLILLFLSWSGSSILAWYGHIIFANWQYRLSFLIILNFLLLLVSYSNSLYFTSNDLYDFYIVIYNFFFWVLYLFFTTNLFTFIFFIEIISTLIILLLTTSTFSSTYFYNFRNLTKHTYLQTTTPITFFKTVLFFFWTSLVGSLNLFVFLLLFYFKILTFDWFLMESTLLYFLSMGNFRSFFFLLVTWFVLIFCIFLKCGLPPFYFWKPTFFKGMPFHALFFYIFFFYFFLSLFLTYFFLIYTNELFYMSSFINQTVLLLGIILVLFLLFESYYIKVFFALSSILNTLLLFLGMTSSHITESVKGFYFTTKQL